MDTPTSVKQAHSGQEACTTRRFFTMTDAEIALASSWRRTMSRDKVSEFRREQSQRLKSRVQKLEEMDASEPTVRVDVPPARPAPTYQEGGSSASVSDERYSKLVKFAKSRGQKRQGEDVEELDANAEEQHLDADVEVRAHTIYRIEDVAGDAGSRSARTDADGGKVHTDRSVREA